MLHNPMDERQRKRIRAAIELQGLRLVPHGPRSWRISGPGVDLITADLAAVSVLDLRPAPAMPRT